jgi:hypothetical protein
VDELDLPVLDFAEVEPDELERPAAPDLDDELWADVRVARRAAGRSWVWRHLLSCCSPVTEVASLASQPLLRF